MSEKSNNKILKIRTSGKRCDEEDFQEVFLKVYEQCKGNLSHACRLCGVTRKTVYNLLERDEAFREAFNEIRDQMVDYVESKLMEQIENGNTAAIIFYLKTIGRYRGFKESHDDEDLQLKIVRDVK